MHVNIYTWSQVKNLKIAPVHEGYAAGYVMEAITAKGPATRTETVLLENITQETNKNHAEMLILIRAMEHMRTKTDIDIYTENTFIANQFATGNVQRWEANDWKNAKGETVNHAELYERLLDLLDGNTVKWHGAENHGYRKWLKHEVEEKRDYLNETERL